MTVSHCRPRAEPVWPTILRLPIGLGLAVATLAGTASDLPPPWRRMEGSRHLLALIAILAPVQCTSPGAGSGMPSVAQSWRKASTWRAVHSLCDGSLEPAEWERSKSYLEHLGDPAPAPCTSGYGNVPIVRAVGDEGQLVQFTRLRDYVEWRMDLEKKTATDRQAWCLFLRGSAYDGLKKRGIGRDGLLRERSDIEIPAHYNVSRSLLYETWQERNIRAASSRQLQDEERKLEEQGLQHEEKSEDEDDPLPPKARIAFAPEASTHEVQTPKEEFHSSGRAVQRGVRPGTRARPGGKRGARGTKGSERAQRLRGGGGEGPWEKGINARMETCRTHGEVQSTRIQALQSRPLNLRLRGGLTLLTHNMLASPLPGLEDSQRYPLAIEARQVELRRAGSAENRDEKAANDSDSSTLLLSIIPRLDWSVLLGAVDQLRDRGSLTLLDPLPASADVALRLCQQGHAQTIQTLRHVLTETHIVTGDLICPASRTRFPIVNGVPNFVDDQLHAKARSLQADRASSAMQESGQESAAE